MGVENDIKDSLAVLAKESYRDVLHPTAKKVGEALERTFTGTVGWMFIPIEYSAAYKDVLSYRIKKIGENLKNVHAEQIVNEVSPQLIGPIFDGLKYIPKGNILEELYLNLLSKAFVKDSAYLAHPSFPFKISQLSPDEALMLFYLRDSKITGYDIHQVSEDDAVMNVLEVDFTFPASQFLFPNNIPMYLFHLASLELLDLKCSYDFPDKNRQGFIGMKTERCDFNISLSMMGRLFVDASIPQEIRSK